MKQLDRTKGCWNCEADVSYEATYCPFCGTDLLNSSSENQTTPQDTKFADQTIQESLASLYKPPYSVRDRQGLGVPDEREESTFKEVEPPKEDPLFQSYEQVEVKHQEIVSEETEVEVTRRGSILPLLFLMMGTHFLVLGMLLLFCSKGGVVTLEWSSRFWFVYCLMGFPLIYFGNRLLKSLKTL